MYIKHTPSNNYPYFPQKFWSSQRKPCYQFLIYSPRDGQAQGLANIFYSRPDRNIFLVFYATTQLCFRNRKGRHGEDVNEWELLCANKTLLVDTEIPQLAFALNNVP